jgi:uncharacterized membrane protein YphA (DoxX/SURF4 family)
MSVPAWPKYALRITFGVIWMIDAVLKWLPGFRSGYMASIKGAGMGQPGWLQWWFHLWTNLQHPAPTFWAVLVAILETLVALAVILGFARKVSYIASAVFCVVIWGVADAGCLHRHRPLQRGLLPRAEDLLVAQDRRGGPPGPGAAGPGRSDSRTAGRDDIGRSPA